jgi:hypothetical protein
MAPSVTEALHYSELEMSKVDAQLQRDGELLVILSPQRAKILIALIEASRGLTRHPPIIARLRLLSSGLWATLRAVLFHGRLMDLSRVLVYFSASAICRARDDGHVEFRFSR